MINNVYELVQMLPKKFKSIKRKSLNSKQASSSETSSMGLNKIFFLSDQEALAKFEAVFSGNHCENFRKLEKTFEFPFIKKKALLLNRFQIKVQGFQSGNKCFDIQKNTKISNLFKSCSC